MPCLNQLPGTNYYVQGSTHCSNDTSIAQSKRGHKGPGGVCVCVCVCLCRGRALLFLKPKCQMWVGGQCHAAATLALGKTWHPLCRGMGGPQGRSGWMRKISPPPLEFDPRTIQPVANLTVPTTLSQPFYTLQQALLLMSIIQKRYKLYSF